MAYQLLLDVALIIVAMGALHRFEGTFGRRRPEPDRDHRDHRRRLARRRPDVVRPGPVVGSAAAERVRAGPIRERNLGPARRAGLRESSRGISAERPVLT